MESGLRIIIIEDDPFDLFRIERELKRGGLSFLLTQVQSGAQLRRELCAATPDLVLSDHGLPSFDGFAGLRIVRENLPELPFIFVSGSNDQGMIVEMFEQGATDYVFKNELGDLTPAVKRAVHAASQPAGAAEDEAPKSRETQPAREHVLTEPEQLRFCPRCEKVRDNAGVTRLLGGAFGASGEVMVVRSVCDRCQGFASIE